MGDGFGRPYRAATKIYCRAHVGLVDAGLLCRMGRTAPVKESHRKGSHRIADKVPKDFTAHLSVIRYKKSTES